MGYNIKFQAAGLVVCVILIALILPLIAIFTNELFYAQDGTYIYSYGKPSDAVYFYSTLSVLFVIVIMLSNIKVVPMAMYFTLSADGTAFTQECNDVPFMFMDIAGFTKMSNEIWAVRIVNLLHKGFGIRRTPSASEGMMNTYVVEQ